MIGRDVFSIQKRDKVVATATLRIDMIADLICPWCYLGKRRLDAALASVGGPSIVNWNPFQLNPDMPAAGMSLDEYLATRFGDPKAVQPALDELTRIGETEGVRFRFERITRVPNTVDAHCLLMYAESQGVATGEIAESILKSFFDEGRDISDREVLFDIGREYDLERHAMANMLDQDQFRHGVLAREAQLRRGGVSGVPGFLVNDRLFVVGAQPAITLVDVFDRVMFGAESDLPLQGLVH